MPRREYARSSRYSAALQAQATDRDWAPLAGDTPCPSLAAEAGSKLAAARELERRCHREANTHVPRGDLARHTGFTGARACWAFIDSKGRTAYCSGRASEGCCAAKVSCTVMKIQLGFRTRHGHDREDIHRVVTSRSFLSSSSYHKPNDNERRRICLPALRRNMSGTVQVLTRMEIYRPSMVSWAQLSVEGCIALQ